MDGSEILEGFVRNAIFSKPRLSSFADFKGREAIKSCEQSLLPNRFLDMFKDNIEGLAGEVLAEYPEIMEVKSEDVRLALLNAMLIQPLKEHGKKKTDITVSGFVNQLHNFFDEGLVRKMVGNLLDYFLLQYTRNRDKDSTSSIGTEREAEAYNAKGRLLN
jgi:hypothetical protein